MKFFEAIGNFFRRLSGTTRCKNLAELRAYIKPGNIYGLAHWIAQRTWYKPDKKLNEEWQDVNLAISSGECDCEEKALIAQAVISFWRGYLAEVVCLISVDPRENHAVCLFHCPSGETGIIDDSQVIFFPKGGRLSVIVRENWPQTIYYMSCDNRGIPISIKTYL